MIAFSFMTAFCIRKTHESNRIQRQIRGVTQLSSYGAVFEDWVHTLAIRRYGSSLEVLHILADSQCFANQAELLLNGFEGYDKTRRIVRAVEVPGIESREVLYCAQ